MSGRSIVSEVLRGMVVLVMAVVGISMVVVVVTSVEVDGIVVARVAILKGNSKININIKWWE